MNWSPEIVVAAVDGSEGSLRAGQAAADLSRSFGATLHLVTAVRPPEGWWSIETGPPPARAVSDALVRAQGDLDESIKSLNLDGVNVETSVELGTPSTTIAKKCEAVNADVLVIGRRGAGLIERLVLGSTADRLVHFAPCSVLVVP